MTVKELLTKEPYPDTPVGIYELSEDNKPEPLLLGDRLAADREPLRGAREHNTKIASTQLSLF